MYGPVRTLHRPSSQSRLPCPGEARVSSLRASTAVARPDGPRDDRTHVRRPDGGPAVGRAGGRPAGALVLLSRSSKHYSVVWRGGNRKNSEGGGILILLVQRTEYTTQH